MKKIQSVSQLVTTQDFPLMPKYQKFQKIWLIFPVLFFSGFLLSKLIWPTYRMITVEKNSAVYQKKSLPESEEVIERKANQKMVNFLRGSWFGVLEVKDNEAQTVLRKRAAIGSKQGFLDLKNHTPYIIHNYFVHQNTGYGIVEDDQKNFFLLQWHSGLTKAPSTNPGAIMIPSGRRIEICNP